MRARARARRPDPHPSPSFYPCPRWLLRQRRFALLSPRPSPPARPLSFSSRPRSPICEWRRYTHTRARASVRARARVYVRTRRPDPGI